MAMPPSSLVMLFVAATALAAIAWMGWKGLLELRNAEAREAAAITDQHPLGGALLLFATVGTMLAASIGAGIGAAIINTQSPTLGQQAIVQWIAVGIGVMVVLTLATLWPVARHSLGPNLTQLGPGVRWGIIAALLILPTVWGIGAASAIAWRSITGTPHDPLAHATLSAMMQSPRDLGWWLMVAAVVIAAPLFEELLYRGLLQGGLWRTIREMSSAHAVNPTSEPAPPTGRSAWIAIIIASAIFALLHAGVAAWIAMPSLFALSIALGWLRIRTGGLIAPIIVHAAFNAMNLILASLMHA